MLARVLAALVALYVLLLAPGASAEPPAPGFELSLPKVVLSGVPFEASLELGAEPKEAELGYVVLDEPGGEAIPGGRGRVSTRDPGGAPQRTLVVSGLRLPSGGARRVVVELEGRGSREAEVRAVPAWLSLVPPALAIGLAVAFRQVLVALFAGVVFGATVLSGFDPLAGLLSAVDTYALEALADRDHASVIVFSLLLGGAVGVVTRSGGASGLATLVTKRATTRRGGQVTTFVLGLLVFFDDYANSLLVGPTMRPITDRLRISREKLAFLVDATAAPVASLALVSSWVGVELGYIADQSRALGLPGDAYVTFLKTIPLRSYPILMLVFVALVAFSGRDFGPMRSAERRALGGAVFAEGARPAADLDSAELRPAPEGRGAWLLAALPIGVIVAVTIAGMLVTGLEAAGSAGKALTLRNVVGSADSYKSLIWAALAGGLVAVVLSVARRALSLGEAVDAWLAGLKSLVLAMLILVLAWALGALVRELHTASYITAAIGPWLRPGFLPAFVFVVSAVVSFATGTSWGTMGVVFPLVMPLAHAMSPGNEALMLGAISSVLAGAVWGDHCSPISDTTIMSSMASGCDHVDHVRTQMPYALVVGLVSIVFGDLATGFGLYGPWVGLWLGALALAALVFFVGKKLPEEGG